MKKGIIIVVLITLSLILFRPTKINATQANSWAYNLQEITRADFKSCTGSLECNNILASSVYSYEREMIINTTAMAIGNNGYVIETPTGTLKSGYLYTANYYLCSDTNIRGDSVSVEIYGTSYSSGVNNKNIYTQTTRSALGNSPTDAVTFNYCDMYSGLFVPDKDYTWTAIRFRSSSVISGVNIAVIAVELKELGIYTSSVQNIIQNSGFATSESVDQVQESVDRVEEAITGEYDYNDTPSEELEGKEEIDNLKNKEEELLGNLDFSGAEDIEITIEPESASFIWQVVDSLRSMSGKIVLLITSILGLGIIKMILNR